MTEMRFDSGKAKASRPSRVSDTRATEHQVAEGGLEAGEKAVETVAGGSFGAGAKVLDSSHLLYFRGGITHFRRT